MNKRMKISYAKDTFRFWIHPQAIGGILLAVTGLQRNWLIVAFGCFVTIYAAFARSRNPSI
jgi:hypothetical protein